MIRTIWGDPDRFKKSYYPDDLGGKYYLAGDGANRDLDGYFWIMGRIDDVLNVSGHRLGTMEIESALVANPHVAEAEKIAKELREWVAKEIGPIAKPKDIRFGDNLPKTRSGKIMRRLLRSLAKNEDIAQDTSTLENPQILEQLKEVK
jgi:acetyl-CoA synthetase